MLSRRTPMQLWWFVACLWYIPLLLADDPEDFVFPQVPVPPPPPRERIAQPNQELVSCGSCCYTIEPATEPLDTTFFSKMINLRGFLIASSAEVEDAALYQTALIIDEMSQRRPAFLDILVAEGVVHAVIGRNQLMTDIPDYAVLGDAWSRFRGVGPTRSIPMSSCGEENALCLQEDVYYDQSICVHEYAHGFQGSGRKLLTPRTINSENLDDKLRAMYQERVVDQGLWDNTYAATNHEEYWAIGAQAYFDVSFKGPIGGNGIHNHVSNRTELQAYDIKLFRTLRSVFGADARSLRSCPSTECVCETFTCPADVGGSIGFCFSANTMVDVQNRGRIRMDRLQVGDRVKVNQDGDYETVYAFGHRDASASTRFLALYWQDQPEALEITKEHMLLVQKSNSTKPSMIPAQLVKVGDHVVSASGEMLRIHRIRYVYRQNGAFVPFTKSGTIVVNGVVASNYISMQGETLRMNDGVEIPVSMQWIGHTFVTPYRIYCTWTSCRHHGGDLLVTTLLPSASWYFDLHPLFMWVLLVPLTAYLVVMAALERVLDNLFVTVPAVALVFVMCRRASVYRPKRQKLA